MVNRLNNLVPSNASSYPGSMSMPMNFANPSPFGNSSSYPPGMSHNSMPGQAQMQMPEIRSEADLAVFNQFMMSLGRDAANHMPQPMAHGASYDSHSGSSASPLSTESPIEDLFNPDELASLGLGNMPGMATSLPTDLGLNQSYGHMYPSLSGLDMPRHRTASSSELDMSKRPIAGLPRSHSVANKGSNGYPNNYGMEPSAYAEVPDFGQGHGDYANPMPNDYSSFDSLARSKTMPIATMAPRDFYKKTYRHVAPLGAAVSSRGSALRESSERTEMDDDDEDDQSVGDMTPKISVRSLLVDEEDIDPQLRLPAIESRQHGSISIPSLHDSHLDIYARGHEVHLPTKRHTEDELTGGVKRLELADREYSSSRSPEAADSPRRPSTSTDHVKELRRRHTALIKSWIVAVNIGFKRRQAEEAARRMDEEDELDREREDSDEATTPLTPRAAEILA
jgi:hypothetical protein